MSLTTTSIIVTECSPTSRSILTLKSPTIQSEIKSEEFENSENINNINNNNNNNNNNKNIKNEMNDYGEKDKNSILFSKILADDFIRTKIFKGVKRFGSKVISRKYKDIISLEWMINHKHWGLIKDKIQQGHNLIISSVCRKIIFSIPDFNIFKMCFERYIEYFPRLYPTLIDHAAYYGNYEMVVYLHNKGYTASPYAIDNASRWGNLQMVKFLKENRNEGCTDSAMENAVAFNDLELVKYIHQQLNEPCTLFAIDHASSNGSLEILQYLHKNLGNNGNILGGGGNGNGLNNSGNNINNGNNSNGGNNNNNNSNGGGGGGSSSPIISSSTPSTPKRSKALDLAAQYGHLDCLKYLIQNNIIPPTNTTPLINIPYSPRGGRSSNTVALAPDSHIESPLYSATKRAIEGGHLEIVKYLYTLYQPNTIEVFTLSITKGQLEILEFYMSHCGNIDFEGYFRANFNEDFIASALLYKNLELIKVCHIRLGIEITPKAFDIAVRFVDRPDLLAYLLQEKPIPDGGFNPNLLSDCCIYNNLAAIKALVIFGGEPFYLQPQSYCSGMEIASASGFFEIIQYLNDLDQSLSIGNAIDKAAINGHLSIVKYLTENRPSAHCTTDAVDKAVNNGHEEVVRYLLNHRTEGATSRAISNAAYLGDLDMVMFLHNSGQPCSKVAINNAASNGNLDIIQFLQKNRTEGCTEQALINAISGTCFDTVKFIIEQYCPRDVQITESTMVAIGEAGDLSILKYFKDVVSRTVSVNLDFSHILKPAFNYGYLDIIKYCLQPSGSTTPRTPNSSSSPPIYHTLINNNTTNNTTTNNNNNNNNNNNTNSTNNSSPTINNKVSPLMIPNSLSISISSSSSSSFSSSSTSSSPVQSSSPIINLPILPINSISSTSPNNSNNDLSPTKHQQNSSSSSSSPSLSSSIHLSVNGLSSMIFVSPLSLPLTKELISISYSRGHSHILEHLVEYHPKPLAKYLSTIELSPRKRIIKYDEHHLLNYLKNVNSRINSKSKPTISIFSKILPINLKKLNK
ncbi:hypothetical protein ACTA71_004738 [Dictyostelium dimigraforme]